jgi:hypothetical protein
MQIKQADSSVKGFGKASLCCVLNPEAKKPTAFLSCNYTEIFILSKSDKASVLKVLTSDKT